MFFFYRDDIFYSSSQIMNGLYVLEMNNEVLNINNKRLKSSRESETHMVPPFRSYKRDMH
jgi:hypothetical protein